MLKCPESTACFRAFNPDSDWNVRLKKPFATRLARDLDEVREVVAFADQASRRGAWVALALAYEAAPAFDSAMAVPAAGVGRVLAWAAAFAADQAERNFSSRLGAGGDYRVGSWRPRLSAAAYQEAIARIHRRIAAGDTYQVNYTFGLDSAFDGDAGAWFDDLRAAQQADFCALLNLPDGLLISLSPELFFRRDGDLLTCRPMKGTSRRGRFADEDRELAGQLSACRKNRAENLMIVDLLRNDLGRIARSGTVQVPALFEVERFRTVLQMTSTVQARVGRELSLSRILEALFPCGSITGAPKISTMRIIRDLETGPRGFYTGAVGFVKPGGDCVFNVPIRTVAVDKVSGRATCHVGGGVTADSTAAGEYDEALLKAAFLTAPPPDFCLLETMLLEGGDWFLAKRHECRLREAAEYFRFPLAHQELLETLAGLRSAHPHGRWKVRLLLDPEGRLHGESEELPGSAVAEAPLRVGLASDPVDEADPFLFHKTTRRDLYRQARQRRPDCDEVILWNRQGEATEACAYNLVVEIDGRKWTPPVACGLLPGTFRAELLSCGEIGERVIALDELGRADRLWLINSVRKWRPARLV